MAASPYPRPNPGDVWTERETQEDVTVQSFDHGTDEVTFQKDGGDPSTMPWGFFWVEYEPK